MRERINKPRVFLSHARKDVAFIERIETDLRKCQIEPWRDQTEIRDGQPFMESIFEGGIPTCDAVLAYFTENSINSEMVKKEIDSALLRRLEESNVAFLPYLDEDKTRAKLRVDIRALQCRVWNEENYSEILPSVVAEIWRSYLERSIETVTLQERNKRLELELEVKRLNEVQGEEIFAQQEEKEFQYIFNSLDFSFFVSIPTYIKKKINERSERFTNVSSGYYRIRISFLQFLLRYIKRGYFHFDEREFCNQIEQIIVDEKLLSEFIGERQISNPEVDANFYVDLIKYGLIGREPSGNKLYAYEYFFTDKMSRFLFWIDYKEVKGFFPIFEFIDFVEVNT
jgi:TIR domain